MEKWREALENLDKTRREIPLDLHLERLETYERNERKKARREKAWANRKKKRKTAEQVKANPKSSTAPQKQRPLFGYDE